MGTLEELDKEVRRYKAVLKLRLSMAKALYRSGIWIEKEIEEIIIVAEHDHWELHELLMNTLQDFPVETADRFLGRMLRYGEALRRAHNRINKTKRK